MELRRTEQGFALYKEKDCIGTCAVRPAAQGADIAALCIAPQWRRRGYGSYLLKEVLRTFAGYDRERPLCSQRRCLRTAANGPSGQSSALRQKAAGCTAAARRT